MAKLNSQHDYNSLRCYMIFQKSLEYADLQEPFLVLKSVIFVNFFSGFFDELSIQKNSIHVK